MNRPLWVLDDNISISCSLASLLRVDGFDTVAMTQADEVWRGLEYGVEPAVLILDLHMPGSNGNEIIRQLMEKPQYAFPVIVYSGYPEEIDHNVSCRVSEVIPKSTRPRDVLAIIKKVLMIP